MRMMDVIMIVRMTYGKVNLVPFEVVSIEAKLTCSRKDIGNLSNGANEVKRNRRQ